jgi:hypothetical protein
VLTAEQISLKIAQRRHMGQFFAFGANSGRVKIRSAENNMIKVSFFRHGKTGYLCGKKGGINK